MTCLVLSSIVFLTIMLCYNFTLLFLTPSFSFLLLPSPSYSLYYIPPLLYPSLSSFFIFLEILAFWPSSSVLSLFLSLIYPSNDSFNNSLAPSLPLLITLSMDGWIKIPFRFWNQCDTSIGRTEERGKEREERADKGWRNQKRKQNSVLIHCFCCDWLIPSDL